MRKIAAAVAIAFGLSFAGASVASADQPGAGDKQCVPGQQGNPHPAYKAGVC